MSTSPATSTQGQLNTCNSSLSSWQAWAASLQSQLNTCNSSLSSWQAWAASLQSQLNTCNSSLSSCQATEASLQSQLSACQAAIARPLKTGQTAAYVWGDDGMLQKGVARGYIDNGNGTITDVATGLMWEKKSYDVSIHDWRNAYTWHDALNSFIGTLNAIWFAGYNDWRLPNINELQTLVDYAYVNPAIYPGFTGGCTPGCTVTSCSCTQSGYYWSATTYAGFPASAWYVLFYDGFMTSYDKTGYGYVRAVRGGS